MVKLTTQNYKKRLFDSRIILIAIAWGLGSFFIGKIVTEILSYIEIMLDYLFQIILWLITFPTASVEWVISKTRVSINQFILISIILVVAWIASPIALEAYNVIRKIQKKAPL